MKKKKKSKLPLIILIVVLIFLFSRLGGKKSGSDSGNTGAASETQTADAGNEDLPAEEVTDSSEELSDTEEAQDDSLDEAQAEEEETGGESSDAEEPEDSEDVEGSEDSEEAEASEAESEGDAPVDGIRPSFKKMVDEYEAFFDSYVEFMKKYEETDGTDAAMLLDYARFMQDYADAMEAMEKLEEDEEMSSEELVYYTEAMGRINVRLAEVAQ